MYCLVLSLISIGGASMRRFVSVLRGLGFESPLFVANVLHCEAGKATLVVLCQGQAGAASDGQRPSALSRGPHAGHKPQIIIIVSWDRP